MAVGDAGSLLQQLPQPGPSQQEILFRRMLLQCLQRTQHGDGEPLQLWGGGQTDWRSDPRFHCVVESLQERLFDLEQSAADRPGPDVLQLYRGQVAAIAGELRQPDLPAYCLRPAAAAAATQRARGDSAAAATADTSESLLQAAARTAAAPRSSAKDTSSGPTPPSNSQGGAAAASSSSSSSSSAPQVALSSGAQERLRTQQRLQDELTSELLDMGQELKASTLSMQNAIRYRGKLLDDAEVSLVDSTANAQAVAAKAKQQHSQGRWNFCQTLLILLAVAVMFCGMVVWIKLTSMVGLKGR